jgi:hypothetical protein
VELAAQVRCVAPNNVVVLAYVEMQIGLSPSSASKNEMSAQAHREARLEIDILTLTGEVRHYQATPSDLHDYSVVDLFIVLDATHKDDF